MDDFYQQHAFDFRCFRHPDRVLVAVGQGSTALLKQLEPPSTMWTGGSLLASLAVRRSLMLQTI